MVSEKEIEEHKEKLSKYVPERDYAYRGYNPFGGPFLDLCKNCDLYYEMLNKKGLTKKKFPPSCSRHIANQFDDIDLSDLTEEEHAELIVASDPVAWAYQMFGWEARWYQEEILSCTALRKVVRAGRRVGKTIALAILALHKLATESDKNVLIIAPYEVQVTKIFDEIDRFVALSPALSNSVRRKTRNPCRIQFNNGSNAIGFSSGANSTAGSDKIRGQDANYIIIDEADYINQLDIDAILAILASHPDCGLWASSTPTGLHEKFYQFCIQKDLGFKEFWYISAEAPNWTSETEEFLKNSTDSTTYQHEYYAEFGLQTSGVFRNDLIDLSIINYSIPRERTRGSRIVIGVDWNGQAIGTHIVVTEAVLTTGNQLKYVVLEKHIVKGEEYTQHGAVKKIIELSEKFNPAFIYVDAGYGETQVEMLHKYGKENPETKLHKIVKPYSMQAKIEIRDPKSNMKIKKPAKPFMVSMAVMQLEQGRIILPISEDTSVLTSTIEGEGAGGDQGLVQQMRNFSIERISASGIPQYSQGQEHTLVAWMLSLVGFVLEMSDLMKGIKYIPILPVPPLGVPKDEAENHENVRLADTMRQLDTGVKLPRYNNMSSIAVAIKDGQKLKQAVRSGDRRAMISHFKGKVSRNSDLGTAPNRSRGARGSRKTF
jgi:replicative DNA helicase